MLEEPYLLAAQASSFLISHLSPLSKHRQSGHTFGTLPPTVQYLCDLRYTIPHHWSQNTSHPNLHRERGDFPMGGKYSKDVPLPTFLAYMQPV